MAYKQKYGSVAKMMGGKTGLAHKSSSMAKQMGIDPKGGDKKKKSGRPIDNPDDFIEVPTYDTNTNERYMLSVKKGSPYAKQAEEYGSVIQSLRPGGPYSKDTDPNTAGISAEESTRRRDILAFGKPRDPKSGNKKK